MKFLKSLHLKKSEVSAFAKSDLNDELDFAAGAAAAAGGVLYIVKPVSSDDITDFKGIGKDDAEPDEFEIQTFRISDIEKIDVMKTVCGGVLVVTAGGVDHKTLSFTNRRMGEQLHLCAAVEALKENREIPSDKKREEYCPKCGNMYPDPDRKICPKCMDKSSVFFRTLRYFKPHRGKLTAIMICCAATSLLNLVWPYLSGTVLYDYVLSRNEQFAALFSSGEGRFVLALGLVVLAMLLTKAVIQLFDIIKGVLNAKTVPDVVRSLKSDIFRSMGKLSISFYNSSETGSLMTRVISDAGRVTSLYLDGIPFFVINIMTIILTVVMMFIQNARLALISVIFLPVLVIISTKLLPRLWHFFGKRHRAERSLNSRIHDNIHGARVVKAFGQQESEIERFSKYAQRVQRSELSLVGYNNKYFALYSSVQAIINLAVWGFGSYLILSGTGMELGMLITFASYVSQLAGPMQFMSRFFHMWVDSMNAAQRLFEIIDSTPEITESRSPKVPEIFNGTVEFKNVTFGYDEHEPVLKNVSLKVEGGSMLGIVGRSGAGKSTLVNLISRLYDVQEGEILIDGINVKDLPFYILRKNIAMVSQETYIFIGTVAENIAYANPHATKDEIIKAAVLASAHDFILKMPDGYDTVIGSSGRQLSGGERQRISIARAILANPKILILDEATASVDTETEKAIGVSINYLIKGRTTISIAHRLSTLRDADKLVVIDDGCVTEQGTHDELFSKKGTYYKLRELQTKALALKGIE